MARLQLNGINFPDEFHLQALMLAEVVKRILKAKGGIELSSPPKMVKKPIIEFMKRMRVDGLNKFDEKTYLSTINFYKNETDSDEHKALGNIIVYVPEGYCGRLFRELGYPINSEDEPEIYLDACGSLCNLIGGNFKNGLTQLGYKELYMSFFSVFENEVLNGVEYDQSQKEFYEISFEIKNKKSIVVDMTMGVIPRLSDL